MTKPLVVVESPAKVRTIKKYLGNDYNVAATVGHIKDLPQREMGIDVEDGFAPKYTVIPGKQKVIQALKQAAADAEEVYLAPDPDREGEAIAWHTADVLKKKGRRFYRVLFHELTKDAIRQAMTRPQELDRNKFEAQQARRILDRLVGYQVSPLLWRKVKGGLSAGRVQSVALRIICERERAIRLRAAGVLVDHRPPRSPTRRRRSRPSWSRGARTSSPSRTRRPRSTSSPSSRERRSGSRRCRNAPRETQNPAPPFITSTLQQEAVRKLGFTAKRTMMLAQQLYEGIELGSEGHGRPDHLHANGLHARRRERREEARGSSSSASGATTARTRRVRWSRPSRRPGRARGHSADLGCEHARAGGAASQPRPAGPLPARSGSGSSPPR